MKRRESPGNRRQTDLNKKRSFNRKPSGKRNPGSGNISPSAFIRKATALPDDGYIASRDISGLPVHRHIISNLLKKGYQTPTEIQDRTLEAILEGKNLIGLAQTGTGKTGAFLVPLVNNLLNSRAAFQVLVIAPTRELAMQTDMELQTISKGLGLFSLSLIGGTSVNADLRKLQKPCHFVIGTPGRLTDMVRQGALDLNRFNTLVLDEFDRLLDMGFSQDINRIVDGMNNRKQTILFSATEDKGQKQLLNKLLDNPVEIRVLKNSTSPDAIDQDIVSVKDGENKMDVLLSMLRDKSFEKVLVFAETKRRVSLICRDLRRAGIKADEIHGDKSQNYRTNALNSFKNMRIKVLVATDVAARGLDISDISHVINYQQPRNMDSYIHRIGRTGRAGKSGKAITFIN
jgi:ATP-dependent RNA helicase RhlE